tara:strand:- start:10060 stop:10332 length:273 start_codon:yes stop_codon:yes gene_type:complete
MVINIETAQNGFVVRDTAETGTPIIVQDFNALVNILVQAFNIKLDETPGEGTVVGENTAANGSSTASTEPRKTTRAAKKEVEKEVAALNA